MGNLTFRVPLIEYERISDRPGNRDDPMNPGTTEHHNGIDFVVPIGKEVKSSERGLVIRASEHWAFGNLIIIDHTPLAKEKGRHIYTLYGHLSKMEVDRGDFVSKGHVIGKSGDKGEKSTGPHLHFGLFDSKTRLDFQPTGSTSISGSLASNPTDYFFRTFSVEGTIADADDLGEQVTDRITQVMELVPTVKLKDKYWRMDIMVYDEYVGFLDTRNQEITLEYSILEGIEILRKPITKRKAEYVLTR